MNNKFKLPKIDILFQVITYIKSIIFPLIIILFNLIRKVDLWIPVVATSAIIAILTGLAFFSWRSFAYLFEKDRIVIYSGMFQKKEKTIYYSRIHSVNISQNIFHRLFGLANLTIETPGVAGVSGSDGEIRCLSLGKAKYLQQLLQKMGEASRLDEEDRKLALLNSIILNMENSTSRNIVKSEQNFEQESMTLSSGESIEPIAEGEVSAGDAASNQAEFNRAATAAYELTETKPDVQLRLTGELMLKSAFTSLNINLVLVWFAGIFAFADDVYNLFFPEKNIYEDVFGHIDISKSIVLVVVIMLLGAIVLTWLLSIVLYLLKYYDYNLERTGKQITVSYGLLNRQRIVFDQTKVQSLVFNENPLRQWMGFGEIKVNIVRSINAESQVDGTYVVIHPFIRKNEMVSYLEQLMPKCNIAEHKDTTPLPIRSLYTYLVVPFIISLLPMLVSIYWFHERSLYLLILPIIVCGMRYIQFKSAAFSIDGTEMKLVKRSVGKTTVFIKRSKLVTLQEKASPYQRKHRLRKLSVRTLGGLIGKVYTLNGIKAEQIQQARQWLQQYIQK